MNESAFICLSYSTSRQNWERCITLTCFATPRRSLLQPANVTIRLRIIYQGHLSRTWLVLFPRLKKYILKIISPWRIVKSVLMTLKRFWSITLSWGRFINIIDSGDLVSQRSPMQCIPSIHEQTRSVGTESLPSRSLTLKAWVWSRWPPHLEIMHMLIIVDLLWQNFGEKKIDL